MTAPDQLLSEVHQLALSSDVTWEGLARPLLDAVRGLTGLRVAYLVRVAPVGPVHRVLWTGPLPADEVRVGVGLDSTATPPGTRRFVREPVLGPDGEVFGHLCGASEQEGELPRQSAALVRLMARLLAVKLRQQPAEDAAPEAPSLDARREAALAAWESARSSRPGADDAFARTWQQREDSAQRRAVRGAAHQALMERSHHLLTVGREALVSSALRVVVADDDPVVRAIATGVLSVEPGLVLSADAHGGARAIGTTVAEQPDLLVTDYELGDMLADEVVREVRRFSPLTRIVLQSSLPEVHALGRRLGVDRSLAKADGPDRLLDALHALA